MHVVAIRKADVTNGPRSIAATQKALDALTLDSGKWRIEGVAGLYVRARATSKSFLLRRRVGGKLIEAVLGPLAMKEALKQARAEYDAMKPPSPRADGSITLGNAIEQYLEAKQLAPKTVALAKYNTEHYLSAWKDRTLAEIGNDRAGVRVLQQALTKKHRPATSNQVCRLLSAIYRWHRQVNTDLPESPMVVAQIHRIAPREWAYSDDELRAWWSAERKEKDGSVVKLGVSTLGAIKKMWWQVALLTGARKGSIEALKWRDVDLDKKVIRFQVTKGDRPYSVPMCDRLAVLLADYRKSPNVPPSEWCFPSPKIEGEHLIDVKNPNEGVGPAHRLRHSYRTALAQLGASPDQARMLMGHSLGGDVSRGYISAPLMIESLRPWCNAVAQRYAEVLGWK
jgi:integrase